MLFFFTLHLAFVIVEAFVRLQLVLECVDVNIRYFQFFESLIFDWSEAKLGHDASILSVQEHLPHIHSELSFHFFPSARIDVFSCNFGASMVIRIELSSWRKTFRLPLVVHELQDVLVFLLHLSIIAGVPRHQIQRQGYGAIMGSGNFPQLLKEINCDG